MRLSVQTGEVGHLRDRNVRSIYRKVTGKRGGGEDLNRLVCSRSSSGVAG